MAHVRLVALAALCLCAAAFHSAHAVDPSLKIVEFTADWCKPCQSMQPAITKLAREGWQISHVNVDQDAELVRTFQVKSLPTIVILRQGQEVDRIVGAFGYEKLQARFDAAAATAPATVRGQSPAPLAAFPLLSSEAMGSVAASAAAAAPTAAPVAVTPVAHRPGVREMTEAPVSPAQAAAAQTASLARPTAARSSEQAIAIAQAATVRIRIDEPNSIAYGTGTVVNVHGNQALVLTCGHLFRDIKPDAKLSVDVYYGGQPVTVPAQVVSYNAKDCDIGLMEFQMPQPIQPVKIAPLNEAPQIGDVAFSYGCDRGADPTRRDTQIKRINRYLGAANVEIHGAPVVGRSGGGLFDAQGRLIGVCNAADEEDNEGIYAALPVIHEHVAGLKLDELESAGGLASSQAAPQRQVPAQLAAAGVAAAQPAATRQGELQMVPLQGSQAQAQQPAAAGGYWPDQGAASSATGASAASSAQLRCVFRDANGQESHITIDQPSAELIAALRQHAQR